MSDVTCPQCGSPMTTDVLLGLCPGCVLTDAVSGDAPPWEPRFQAGDQLGLYRIHGLLGRGGLGEVYAAEAGDGRQVALKVLRRQLRRATDRAQFLVEAQLAASVSHPNVVYVFEAGEIASIPMIAMELMSGGTLQDRVRRRGPLPLAEAIEAILQVITGRGPGGPRIWSTREGRATRVSSSPQGSSAVVCRRHIRPLMRTDPPPRGPRRCARVPEPRSAR